MPIRIERAAREVSKIPWGCGIGLLVEYSSQVERITFFHGQPTHFSDDVGQNVITVQRAHLFQQRRVQKIEIVILEAVGCSQGPLVV